MDPEGAGSETYWQLRREGEAGLDILRASSRCAHDGEHDASHETFPGWCKRWAEALRTEGDPVTVASVLAAMGLLQVDAARHFPGCVLASQLAILIGIAIAPLATATAEVVSPTD